MTRPDMKMRRFLIIGLLLSTLLIVGACAKKATMIQVGATQFEAESLVAIEKINELRRKETTATSLSREKAAEFFVKSVKQSTVSIDLAVLRVLTDPTKTLAPESEREWQDFLQKMRQQYTTFANTFASLDKGSLLAGPDVQAMIPILDTLIAQMAAFAKSIQENPAEFIRERAAIAAEVEHVRQVQPFTEVTDLRLLELERRLRQIVAAEEHITREAIEQALKAVTLGIELRGLLTNYNQLSLDDIAEGLSVAFTLAAGIPGLDLPHLEAKADRLMTTIKKDETLRSAFDTALSEITKARPVPVRVTPVS